ncbi:MAG: dihydrolipoyl dehydrogenase [Chloroflexi bacterium]|nr:dihydrolipoyl dehydrogenase [Chloroflexota bacterium]
MATNSDSTFDVAVLGAGPGGYIAAIRAAQLGLKTAIIERDQLGGICLNWGCIPTKSLLRNAEVVEMLHQGKDYGFTFDNLQVDYGSAHKRSRDVSGRLVKGVEFLMKKNNIQVFRGEAELTSSTTIRVEQRNDEQIVKANHIILATGARPRNLPGLEPDGQRVFTYRQLLEAKTAPKSMIVIGAGPIGMEFAYVFHAYGAEVTVVEALPRILPLEDEEISTEMSRAFNRAGIKTVPGAKVEGAKVTPDGVELTIGGQTLKAEWVLVSIGIMPNTDNIGLDKAGVVKDQRGYVTVDDHLKTNVPNIYAIGDMTGRLALAHVASAQGVVAAESIAAGMGKYSKRIPKLDYEAMPRCVYTHPQVGSMGMTEAQAKERGYKVKVSKFPFRAIGKAIALNAYDGFVKIVADEKYGEILGLHMIGPDVTELLPEFVLAKSAELTPDQIAHAVHAHPTLSEALMEAAHGVEGQPLSI